MNHLPHVKRMIEEKQNLDEKHKKLVAFFATSTFINLPAHKIALMQLQADAMLNYSKILAYRIALE